MEAFNAFSQATGLQMNQSKSNIFIAGVKDDEAQQIVNATGIQRSSPPFKYLGVPISAKKLSTMESHMLVERIVARIHALGAKKLSYGGRLVLVKAVLSMLHSYWARIFILPTKTLKEINSACRNFLWQGSEHYQKTPPIAWDKICQPKKRGGLGIISPLEWNITAVGKYVWWIAQKKDHLWVKWVNNVYLKGRPWMDYSPPPTASWVWRKVCMVKDKLKDGYHGMWWKNHGGVYNISEGYQWLMVEDQVVPWHAFVWNRASLPKQEFICWLASHNRLRTKDRLHFMHLEDTSCLLCRGFEETHQHLFFECAFSSEALSQIALWLGMPIPATGTAEWWQRLKLRSLMHKKYVAATITSVMYHIWQARNECRLKAMSPQCKVLVQQVKEDIKAKLSQDMRLRGSKHTTWRYRLLE